MGAWIDSLSSVNDDDQQLTGLWTVFYVIILCSLTAQAASLAGLLVVAARASIRFCKPQKQKLQRIEDPVTVVVPCYLPNEAPIIAETINHLLFKLEHVADVEVVLVYNTPQAMPAEEEELRKLAAHVCAAGRRLCVQKVEGSKSKAENLNHVVSGLSATYVAIYDADHHPDPDSLARAIVYLKDEGVDCVQGSTYIRKGCCLARLMVHAEFFVTYFVLMPIMEAVSGSALFGGSNAVWRGSTLRQLRFDEQVLTEDVDCFARAVLQHGFKFAFLPECRSGELLPAGFKAFWTQRLRWAMGWDQVTLRYARSFWNSPLSWRRRLGLYYIFVCRWVTQLCAVVIIMFNAGPSLQALLAQDPTDVTLNQPQCVSEVQITSFYMYAVFISFAFLRALANEAHPRLFFGLVLYFLAAPLYVLFGSALLFTSLVRIASGRTGKWVVTARSHQSSSNSSMKDALLDISRPDVHSVDPILAFGILLQGLVIGSIIGAALGQRQVVVPLWGWVPFGIGSTTETVIDGRWVAGGFLAGAAGSAVAILVLSLKAVRAEGG